MSSSSHGKSTIGRSGYWITFLITVVVSAGLLIGGLVILLGGEWGLGLLMMAAILPISIYFRVVMMRRCRDIGWPAYIPWALLGVGILASIMTVGTAFGDMDSITSGEINPLSAIGALPGIITLVDFGVMITLGCIAGKPAEDYGDVFGGESSGDFKRAGPAPASGEYESREQEEAGWDEAIQRALDKQVDGQADGRAKGDLLPKPGQAVGTSPQKSGFGRKGL